MNATICALNIDFMSTELNEVSFRNEDDLPRTCQNDKLLKKQFTASAHISLCVESMIYAIQMKSTCSKHVFLRLKYLNLQYIYYHITIPQFIVSTKL